jgi:hypothetical protein
VFKDYEMMVFGAVMMGTMIFLPRGIVPSLARLFQPRHRDTSAGGEGGGREQVAGAPRSGDATGRDYRRPPTVAALEPRQRNGGGA